SASHIAFGSTRMEPVFMMASQSAATAAAFAIDDNVPVQQVNYAKLALQLTADAQILTWGSSSGTGVIVDNTDSATIATGFWSNSTSVAGYWGSNYFHDDNSGKGSKSFTYRPMLPTPGTYQVFLRWTTNPNRATNALVDVIHTGGTNTFTIDQTQNNGVWMPLLTT